MIKRMFLLLLILAPMRWADGVYCGTMYQYITFNLPEITAILSFSESPKINTESLINDSIMRFSFGKDADRLPRNHIP